MGVDTHFYLLDHERYLNDIVPVLDRLIAGENGGVGRARFEQAWRALIDARARREFPWTPFFWDCPGSGRFDQCIALIEGRIPETYRGERGCTWEQLEDEGFVIRDPSKVREYHLRDNVCGIVVEGLAVPWELDFPPVHNVTSCLGHSLYDHSEKFEHVICGDIYARCARAPYDIYMNDSLVDQDLTLELAAEIARVAPPGSKLWEDENYRNLYQLFQHAAGNLGFRVLTSYF